MQHHRRRLRHTGASGNKAHQEISWVSARLRSAVRDGLRFLAGTFAFCTQTTKAVATHTLRQHRRDHLCDGCRLRFAVQRLLRDFSQAQRIASSAFAANSNLRNVISKKLAIPSQKAGHFCEPKVTRKTASWDGASLVFEKYIGSADSLRPNEAHCVWSQYDVQLLMCVLLFGLLWYEIVGVVQLYK